MAQTLLEQPRERTEYRTTVRRRSPVAGYTLMSIGLLAALVGAYLQFAPSDWWLSAATDVYHLGSYAFGGLSLGAGLAIDTRRVFLAEGAPVRVIASTVLALVAFSGALVAGVMLAQASEVTVDELSQRATGSDRHLVTEAQTSGQVQLDRLIANSAGFDRHLVSQAQAAEQARLDALVISAAGFDRHLANQAEDAGTGR